MNHPQREEWIPFLYGEADAEVRQRLSRHLQDCPACRKEVAGWQRSLKRLNAWKLPRLARPRFAFSPFLNWATAAVAVLVIALSFLVGEAAQGRADTKKIRAAIEPEIRQQLRQELVQLLREELANSSTATLAASKNQTADLLRQAEMKRNEEAQALLSAIFAVKKDLDTVAFNTDAGLRTTEQQLIQLAYSQPADSSIPSK